MKKKRRREKRKRERERESFQDSISKFHKWAKSVEAKLHGESKVIQRCFDDNDDDNKRWWTNVLKRFKSYSITVKVYHKQQQN